VAADRIQGLKKGKYPGGVPYWEGLLALYKKNAKNTPNNFFAVAK
jgi:hypothetical protein